DHFADARRYQNASQALQVLLKQRAIPIINENDTIAIEEIKVGDNDTLSAQVASLLKADLLVLLTDVDGLYTANPNSDPNAKHLPVITK
ncbi:amino acid kinase family protein, partial [Streptococcus suis]